MQSPRRVKLPKPDGTEFQPQRFGARCFIGGRAGRLKHMNDSMAVLVFDDGAMQILAATHGGSLEIEVCGDLELAPFSGDVRAAPSLIA